MRVTWITDDKHAPSIVEYGKQPGTYSAKVTGNHTSYRYFFYSSGKIHHVKIGPLEPGTIYYYRCGGSGPELSFKTPPATFPLEFVVIGKHFAYKSFHDHALLMVMQEKQIMVMKKKTYYAVRKTGIFEKSRHLSLH